jgi:hypothetical protein
MTTPRSHKEEETEPPPAAAAAAEPSSVAIGLSTLAGVPADLSSYLWGSKNEEAAVEEGEVAAVVEEEEGTGVRYVATIRAKGGRGAESRAWWTDSWQRNDFLCLFISLFLFLCPLFSSIQPG